MFYLDNAATTQVLPDVLEKCLPSLKENFGNPSSLHKMGMDAFRAIKSARRVFERLFNVSSESVIFCGSGTEANHLAIWGVTHSPRHKGKHIIVSSLEHPCVLRSAEALQKLGYQVEYVRSLSDGTIDLEHLESLIVPDTCLISCMVVNNEIGTQQPYEKIGSLIKQINPNIIFHVDAVQAFTKIPINIKPSKIDLISISSHKIGAPKGVGALINTGSTALSPVILGGGQESGMRSGTENVFGITAFAEATLYGEQQREVTFQGLKEYKQKWIEFIEKECPQVWVYQSQHILPHFLNISIPKIPAEVFLHHLEAEEIYVSTGSACSSKKMKISHVLQALGIKPETAQSMIRMSFTNSNLFEDQQELFSRFLKVVNQLDSLI